MQQRHFRAVTAKKGGIRYYITRDIIAEDLITDIPPGFEVAELPYDGRVVIRKKIPSFVSAQEVAVVKMAMINFSPVKDFIITVERNEIAIHISQFNHYFEANYLTAEQAREVYGETVDSWKCYDWIMTFALLNQRTRIFQVKRKANVQYSMVPIDEGSDLEALAEKYCYHVGRESLLQFWIPGQDG